MSEESSKYDFLSTRVSYAFVCRCSLGDVERIKAFLSIQGLTPVYQVVSPDKLYIKRAGSGVSQRHEAV
jgi:hypothetical protein